MTTSKPNTGFWIIGVLALLWNLVGIFFWVMEHFMMTDEMKAQYTPEQLELVNSAPTWGMYVYAVAVFGGTLASIFMLMRKKFAVTLFLVSLIAILIQMGYWILGTSAIEAFGPQSIVMPLIVIAIAIFLYFYNKGAAQKGWLS